MRARNDTSTIAIPNLPACKSGYGEAGSSAFTAQRLGEGGQRRGLRGGAPVIRTAREAYLEAEWSGASDRRMAKGGLTRKRI